MKATNLRVVVVGGGFGGLRVARGLRRLPLDITIVDRENHHLFQPLLYQVATAALAPGEIAVPIRAVMRRAASVQVVLGEVQHVDLAGRAVQLGDGRVLPYDYVVLAAGSRTNYFGRDGWAEHAYGLKTLRDALRLKERILLSFEQAEHEPDPARKRQLLTFVVVGGGPTGVELSGAIAELGRTVLARDFRAISPEHVRVILLEMRDRVLPAFDAKLSARAKRQLEELGVEVRLETKVSALGPSWVEIDEERLPCGAVCWAPGVTPVQLGERLGVAIRAGRVVVDPTCAIPGHPEAFVIGDLAHFVPSLGLAADAEPLPALAAVAVQQGDYVASAVKQDLLARPRKPFRYRDWGIMATVGRARAVAQLGRFRLSGVVAWGVWSAVHLAMLISFRNRVLVLYEWCWAFFTRKRGSRVVTRRDAAPASEQAPPLPDEVWRGATRDQRGNSLPHHG